MFYLMVLVQNKYKNTLVSVLRTQTTFVTHSSPLCYVTLRTQVIRLNSGNLGPQKTDSVFLLLYREESGEILQNHVQSDEILTNQMES